VWVFFFFFFFYSETNLHHWHYLEMTEMIVFGLPKREPILLSLLHSPS
jgi:hypothetical protein